MVAATDLSLLCLLTSHYGEMCLSIVSGTIIRKLFWLVKAGELTL